MNHQSLAGTFEQEFVDKIFFGLRGLMIFRRPAFENRHQLGVQSMKHPDHWIKMLLPFFDSKLEGQGAGHRIIAQSKISVGFKITVGVKRLHEISHGEIKIEVKKSAITLAGRQSQSKRKNGTGFRSGAQWCDEITDEMALLLYEGMKQKHNSTIVLFRMTVRADEADGFTKWRIKGICG
ncbi:MAG: hypothetical protein AAF206_13980 [Bacteroidota bacterium]